MDWLSTDSYSLALEDYRIVQRFSLAVLYYATNCPTSWSNWTFNGNNSNSASSWLSSSLECEWRGCERGECYAECSRNEVVDSVSLSGIDGDNHQYGGLSSKIPREIGLLSSLTHLQLNGSNNLEGTIPTEIGLVTSLSTLFVYANKNLEGSIPTEGGLLSSLALL